MPSDSIRGDTGSRSNRVYDGEMIEGELSFEEIDKKIKSLLKI